MVKQFNRRLQEDGAHSSIASRAQSSSPAAAGTGMVLELGGEKGSSGGDDGSGEEGEGEGEGEGAGEESWLLPPLPPPEG